MLDEIAYLVKRFFHFLKKNFSKVSINPLFLNSVVL